MESKDNFMCGLKILLEQRGWGGNSEHTIRTEGKALGRLESLTGDLLIKEMEAVYERNDYLLRAVHFMDRKLTEEFSELSKYISPEEAKGQIRESYHRNNILFDAYKQSVSDANHFPEVPNGHYAEERGWGGNPNMSVLSREAAESRLEQMSTSDFVVEMDSLDKRNDELCSLIHEKEMGIARYLEGARKGMDEAEIKEQIKHAYYRNNIFFDLFKATSEGEHYISELFINEIRRRDSRVQEIREILLQRHPEMSEKEAQDVALVEASAEWN